MHNLHRKRIVCDNDLTNIKLCLSKELKIKTKQNKKSLMFKEFVSFTPGKKKFCSSNKFPASGFVLASTEDTLN
jgi:hypothetical protein